MNAVVDTVILGLVFATLAQAWSWLGAYAGVLSFGHAVFFGIGAYAVAVSNFRAGSPWYGALGGALFAVILAALFGRLFLRGRGVTFAAITLLAGALAEPFVAAHSWIGSGNALSFPVRTGFLNLQFTEKWPYLVLAFVVFGVTQGLTFALRASRIGWYLKAVRTNPVAARSVGVAAWPAQLVALVASAFVTSVAGSLFAQYALGVDPHMAFALSRGLDIALIGLVAGPASPWGAPLAAVAYVLVGQVVPLHPAGAFGQAVMFLEGSLIVALAVFRPNGIWGTFGRPRTVARNAA